MINKNSQGLQNSKKLKAKILQRCYRKAPDIVYRKIADKVILVPIKHTIGDLDSIYTLNETAARIWDLIDGERNVSQVKDMIAEEFEVSKNQAESDIIQLISQLEEIDGIE